MFGRLQRSPTLGAPHNKIASFQSFTSLHADLQYMSEDDELQQASGTGSIPSMMKRFTKVNNTIEIQHDMSNFNLVEYDSDHKKGLQYDQQMINAKLKSLQNKAELKRANMELHLRKRKTMNKQREHTPITPPPAFTPEPATYKELFSNFKQETQLFIPEEDEDLMVTDLPQMSAQKKSEPKPKPTKVKQQVYVPTETEKKSITFFEDLKKHPRILNHTIGQMRSKEALTARLKSQRHSRIQSVRDDIKAIAQTQRVQRRRNRKMYQDEQQRPKVNAQDVAQDIFRRIYTRKHKVKSTADARACNKLNRFVNRQDSILSQVDKRKITKKNYKQMKEKFDDILNDIYSVDRKEKAREYSLQKKQMSQTLQGYVSYFEASTQL